MIIVGRITSGQPEGQGRGAPSQRLQPDIFVNFLFPRKTSQNVTLSGSDFLFPMKFLNSTKLSIPSLSLSNFLKHASTWIEKFGVEGFWVIGHLSWAEGGKAALKVLLGDQPILVLVQGGKGWAHLNLSSEPFFSGKQGWCHLVDLLVDGVQFGNLGRTLLSPGQIVGFGHQLQHLRLCWESLPKALHQGLRVVPKLCFTDVGLQQD